MTLDTTAPTLQDTAELSGGYFETGTITFSLYSPGGTLEYTEAVKVQGDNTYSTLTGFTLPTSGPVIGTYEWVASYSGDGNNDAVSDSDDPDQVTVDTASPTLSTSPDSDSVTLDTTQPTLTDTAELSGGYFETGSVRFSLYASDGTLLHSESVTVDGDGSYTTPDGFTLPQIGTVTGTYQWVTTYSGDANNEAVDGSDDPEPVTVDPASPTMSTSPTPESATLDTSAPALMDTATISGGYFVTGTITFTLESPDDTTLKTETVGVFGDGTYTTPNGYTLPTSGTVTGTYQWVASFSGDGNNDGADNSDDPDEVTVGAASPTISSNPNPASVTLATSAPTLMDTATLSGGYFETGSITFTLDSPSGTPVETQSVPVFGNNTYTMRTGYTLPTTGTATGTYHWVVSYSGDGNNDADDDSDNPEQVTVSSASPTITTTPNPTSVAAGTATAILKDTATLSGGYFETGTITFTLVSPTNTVVDTETAAVSNSNGSYTTPTGYTLPTNATGTYQWNASYSGDGNNKAVSENNNAAERVSVSRTECGHHCAPHGQRE